MSENRSDDDEPFTKTKLFTLGEGGNWTDMGVGVASVADDVDNDEPILRLDITTIPTPEEPEEVLLSTPVSTEDIYSVQKGSILVWCDPELGRDMAASFHSKEGCAFIVDKIKEFQLEIKRRREVANQNDSAGTLNGTGSSLLDDLSSDPLAFSSPWSVCKANLQTILNALFDNRVRIGTHIKDNRDYVFEICTLFSQCSAVVRNASSTIKKEEPEVKKEPIEDESDNAATTVVAKGNSIVPSPAAVDEARGAMERISAIVMKVLDQHSTEVKILSQVVEDRNIETIVDIVQYAIGRRTKESGFMTREERHAMFKDPAHLPPKIVEKIHNFFAVQFLRDLVPQALEEGEPGVSLPLVSLLLIRARHTMLTQIMNENILKDALMVGQSLEHIRGMIGMMLDITTYVKNTSAIGSETKGEVFKKAIELGLMDFIAELFLLELQLPDPRSMSAAALQQAADVLSHLSMWAPIECSNWLLRNAALRRGPPRFDASSTIGKARAAAAAPRSNTTTVNRPLTPTCHPTPTGAATFATTSPLALPSDLKTPIKAQVEGEAASLAAPSDTLASNSVVPPTPTQSTNPSTQESLNGSNDFSKCSLLHLLFEALAAVKEHIALQALGDAIFNIGIGSLQVSAAIQLFGPDLLTLRRRILQYWVNGPDGNSSIACVPLFGLMVAAGQMSRFAPENSAAQNIPRPVPIENSNIAAAPLDKDEGEDGGDNAHIPTSSFTRHLRDLGAQQGPHGRGPHAIRRGPRMSSANDDEQTELQCLKVLRLLTRERAVSCGSQFADLLRTSHLLSNIGAALHPKTLASGRLCCSASEFLAELIKTNASRVLQQVISSNVIDGIVRLHESLPRRNTVLSAGILAVFNTAATSVVDAKQRASNSGFNNSFGGLGGSPYVSRIAASEASGSGAGGDSNSNAPDLALVDHILLHYSSYLGYFAFNVLRKLQRMKETGGEGLAGEESSAVTSYSEARALSGTEFQALLLEYGCAPTEGTPSAVSMDTGAVLSSVPNFSDEATVPVLREEDNESESDDDVEEEGTEQQSPVPRAAQPSAGRLSGSKTPRDENQEQPNTEDDLASPQLLPPPIAEIVNTSYPAPSTEPPVVASVQAKELPSVATPEKPLTDAAQTSPPALVRSPSVKLVTSPKAVPATVSPLKTVSSEEEPLPSGVDATTAGEEFAKDKADEAPSPKRLRSESSAAKPLDEQLADGDEPDAPKTQ